MRWGGSILSIGWGTFRLEPQPFPPNEAEAIAGLLSAPPSRIDRDAACCVLFDPAGLPTARDSGRVIEKPQISEFAHPVWQRVQLDPDLLGGLRFDYPWDPFA
jgi:hypothetical protein